MIRTLSAILLLIMSTINVNLDAQLNLKHRAIFESKAEELLVYGGAGAGKSYSIADKLLMQAIFQPDKNIKVLVIRKTFPSIRATCLQILEKRATALRLPWELNKSDWVARCANVTLEFQSLNGKDDFEKLKSRTDIDFVWINELMELREADYEEILRRLRGGESDYQQVISDFNPTDKFSWVYVRFFEKDVNHVQKLKYTVLDNHDAYLATEKARRYIARLDATAESNPNAYNVYRLGEWGSLEGVIFADWDVQPLPDEGSFEIFYGGDFGFTVDPAAVIKIYRRGDELWLQECIYQTGLTNQDLAAKMHADPEIDVTAESYWDASEPKSIEELYQAGINAHPASKGPDSVRAGIDLLLSLKVHIVPGSEHLIREARSYCWATDKNGIPTSKPADFNNHGMDATRYGVWTKLKDGFRIPRIAAAW